MIALLLLGCAANLATLQTPETLAQGQIAVSGQAAVGLPVGTTARAVGAGARLLEEGLDASQGEDLDTNAVLDAVAAGVALRLNPPGQVFGAAVRVGVVDGLDLGARYSTSDWRLDAKWRFAGDGVSGASHALLVGVQHQRFQGAIIDVYAIAEKVAELIPGLDLGEPKRWDIDAMYLGGGQVARGLKLWGGARYRYGWYESPWVLTGEAFGSPEIIAQEDLAGRSHLLGLSGGLAVGKDPVWVHAELDTGYSFARTTVLGVPVNVGGPIVFPAIGVTVQSRSAAERRAGKTRP